MESYGSGLLTPRRVHGVKSTTVNSKYRCNKTSSRLKKLKTHTSYTNLGNPHAQDHDLAISDSESSSSSSSGSPKKKKFGVFGDTGLVKVKEEENGYAIIKRAFLSGMGAMGKNAEIVAVHKNLFEGLYGQARLQSFRVFSEAMVKKCRSSGGNVKFAWYGTSKDEVIRILNHGFSHRGKSENSGSHGFGLYLSPQDSPFEGVKSSIADEDGLRHVLLCRVILGNIEEIHPGSDQTHPSSKVYDSGVDNSLSPKKYIVWTTNMNTHILPEYVVSFKVSPCLSGKPEPVVMPKSPWMAFPTLISALSKFLPTDTVLLIQKYHSEFQEKKLSRQLLIQHVRQLVGDKLLMALIKSFRAKEVNKEATGLFPSSIRDDTKG